MNLQDLIKEHSDDQLAKEHGHVYQVWEDGEITMQKSGDLLWRRTLHCMERGDTSKTVDPKLFPHLHVVQQIEHGFMFTTEEGATAVRNHILFEQEES